MEKYVVTGGAGFIGSALVRTLLGDGAGEVEVIDNLLTGHERNLAEVRGRIKFHHVDIRDPAAVGPLIRGADVVFHLAAIPSVPRSIDEPVLSHQVNVDGTSTCLQARGGRRCAAAGLRGIFFGLRRQRDLAQDRDHASAPEIALRAS